MAQLSQLILMPGDEDDSPTLFPRGHLDKDGQQEDRRGFNSWMMRLEDVNVVEFLETMYINVVAPFLLCSKLRRSMVKAPDERPSFVINVTAMEGNFTDPGDGGVTGWRDVDKSSRLLLMQSEERVDVIPL